MPKIIPRWEWCSFGRRFGDAESRLAVARKLAVLLHRLWVSGEVYEAVGYATVKQEAAA